MFLKIKNKRLDELKGAPSILEISRDESEIDRFSFELNSLIDEVEIDNETTALDFRREASKTLAEKILEKLPFGRYEICFYETNEKNELFSRSIMNNMGYSHIGTTAKIFEDMGGESYIHKYKMPYFEFDAPQTYKMIAKLKGKENPENKEVWKKEEKNIRKMYDKELELAKIALPAIQKAIKLFLNEESIEKEATIQKTLKALREDEGFNKAAKEYTSLDLAVNDLLQQIGQKQRAIFDSFRIKVNKDKKLEIEQIQYEEWMPFANFPLLKLDRENKRIAYGYMNFDLPKKTLKKGESPFTEYELAITEKYINRYASTIFNYYNKLAQEKDATNRERTLREEKEQINADLEQKNIELEKAYSDLQTSTERNILLEGRAVVRDVAKNETHHLGNISKKIGDNLELAEFYLNQGKAEKAGSVLERAQEAQKQLEPVINRFRDLSSDVKDFEKQDISGSLDDILPSFEGKSGIKIKREYNETPDTLISKYVMSKIYFELLTNAERAYSDNQIPEEDREIVVKKYLEGDYAVIEFKDNAGGIPEKDLEKIFDRDYTTKTSGEGVGGFGLEGCKVGMVMHKGKIEVESEQGKGSVFKLYIPLNDI